MTSIEIGPGSLLRSPDGEEFVVLELIEGSLAHACIGAVVMAKSPENTVLELKVSNTMELKNVVKKLGELNATEVKRAISAHKKNHSKMVMPDIIEEEVDLPQLPKIWIEVEQKYLEHFFAFSSFCVCTFVMF